jgi:hypothetical protein
MPSSSPDLEIRYVNPAAFAKQVKNLNPNHRAVLIMALDQILGRYGLKLAKSPWLRYLGSSLWEFRVGPSSKAVESKANAPFDDIVIIVRLTHKMKIIIIFFLPDEQFSQRSVFS